MLTGYTPDFFRKEFGPNWNTVSSKIANPPRLTLLFEGVDANTAPVEPVPIADLMNYCRVDESVDQALVLSLGKAARRAIEKYLNRPLVLKKYDMYMDHVPFEMKFLFPITKILAVSLIQTYNMDNTTATQDSSTYQVDLNPTEPKVYLNIGGIWNPTNRLYNAFQVTFTCGYANTTTDFPPDDILMALKLLTNTWYEGRNQTSTDENSNLTAGVKALIEPHRYKSLA